MKNPLAETALFQRRALVGLLLVTLGMIVLGGRYFTLQILQHEALSARADQNRIKLRPLVPARGRIYDRNGVLLADNVPAYRLELVPEQVEDLEATLAGLGEVIPLSADELERFHDARRGQRRFHPIPVKLRLSEAEVAAFAVNRHRFPGVDVAPYLTRRYLQGPDFAHVLGYVGRIDRQDAAELDPDRYAGATHIGKAGIERFYESRLHGEVGFEQVEVNAEGRVLRVLRAEPAESGETLYLSIDAALQAATVAAFEGQHGAAVAIDPRTGEVLALVSLPSYDPNLFVNGISRGDYAALQVPSRPLYNRALLGGYEPGSTLKPFVGLAAMELGVMRPEQTVLSVGAYKLPGLQREYRDWRRGGHGRVDLREALAQSVNTYFFQAAVELGIDRMSGYLSRFGFGSPSGIDLIGEASGILPTRGWKQAARNEPWYLGETVIAGIGQGFWVTTPLQLVRATAALADDGRLRTPRLLRETQRVYSGERIVEARPDPVDLQLHAEHLEAVRDGLVAVMHSPTGTAREAARDAGYLIAGKTGTAQRVSRRTDEAIDLDSLPFHLRHRALFIGYAPAQAPTIALAVVVESGGSGSRAAAPVARRIFDAWLARGGGQ
ncbi:penicillin-binding protein 2 [Pseudomarimonas salicorniae]|uniref:Peptidoglycan D,D-transpeptidase MrdA n=1 Tax=Pseudomarimonas salicorniae TaxID=2933270 RepID=A0ABT0GCI6_9GAMM|nr:penicillin-binding protein 2 [Lysobacter sp. CAU 1642]MCK7592082.1 penicillin-binding protein 2 [Lysobacter sp. CAU 1642]